MRDEIREFLFKTWARCWRCRRCVKGRSMPIRSPSSGRRPIWSAAQRQAQPQRARPGYSEPAGLLQRLRQGLALLA